MIQWMQNVRRTIEKISWRLGPSCQERQVRPVGTPEVQVLHAADDTLPRSRTGAQVSSVRLRSLPPVQSTESDEELGSSPRKSRGRG